MCRGTVFGNHWINVLTVMLLQDDQNACRAELLSLSPNHLSEFDFLSFFPSPLSFLPVCFHLSSLLSSPNPPLRPHYQHLKLPDPLFLSFLAEPPHYILLPVTHHSPRLSLTVCSTSWPSPSVFFREMMERSDPGDFLVNQWVITCITPLSCSERLYVRAENVGALKRSHAVW